MGKVALYTKLDEDLDTLLETRCKEEGCTKADLVDSLIQKGLEAERIQNDAEKVKDGLSDHTELKAEISELKQNVRGLTDLLEKTVEQLCISCDNLKKHETIDNHNAAVVEKLDKRVSVLEKKPKSESNPEKKKTKSWSVSDI